LSYNNNYSILNNSITQSSIIVKKVKQFHWIKYYLKN
jgi:DNA-binding ferritin-like protein